MFPVSPRLVAHCRKAPEGLAWLERLPEILSVIATRWQLVVASPFEGGEASWVAPVVCRQGRLAWDVQAG
jgi:hypothetical protein